MPQKRSKIIKDLIMNNIDVHQAMQSLDFMLEEIEDKETKAWLDNELNGYKEEYNIPKYRKTNAILIGNVQVGYNLYKNIEIPLADAEAIKMFSKVEVREPISTIMQMAKAENEIENHSLSLEVNTILVNHYQQTNGNVINAQRKLSLYAYNNILAMIKDKLLEIFKVLECSYGNLDDLYIDFSDDTKKKAVIEKIQSIVYNDNSVKIGDNNEIKNSIVGDADEN